MNLRAVCHLISYLVLFMIPFMLLSCGVGALMGDSWAEVNGFLTSAAFTGVFGGGLLWLTRGPSPELSRKDGFGIVTLGWIMVAVVGAMPFWFSDAIPDAVDALFETISGFTTTGSTILTDIEGLPRGILFWRSLTQWLGGMGVLLLCVAILPFLGVGGMQLYRAEMPGPSKDRLTPRITNTAKFLYGVYVLLTAVEVILLVIAGMSLYDAVNHSFCTLSTGGFSPWNSSVAHYENSAIHWIITVFMFLGGVNFALHFRALSGDVKAYWRSEEFRMYLYLVIGSTVFITLNLLRQGHGNLGILIRDAAFQVVSITTTTGFATADYDTWPLFAEALVFLLLFSGACAGSTSGGLKLMRSVVLIKEVHHQIQLFMQPQMVRKVRLQGQGLQPSVVAAISGFVLGFLFLFMFFTLLLSSMMPDLLSAASAVIACLGNVGPGFSAVGPTQNFSTIPDAGKLLLAFCMLLGRLELFTVLVLFSPRFWKR